MSVNINLGQALKDQALSKSNDAFLDLEELLASRLLVQGNSGSGKSHLLRRLLEQSAPFVQQCIIDPEGDFITLAEQFDHVVIDAARSLQELSNIAGRIRQHRVSVILNLEELETEAQMRATAAFLSAIFEVDRNYWYPMLVVVDEAQLFAPTAAGDVAEEARKLSLSAMTNLMCRGRKRGLAGVIATQRLAKLAKNVAAEASNFLMGRTFLDIDMARAADLLGMERRQAEKFRDLQRGQFIALGPALVRRPITIKIGDVITAARSTSPKLMPLPEKKIDAAQLTFTPLPGEVSLYTKRQKIVAPSKSTQDILEEVTRKRSDLTKNDHKQNDKEHEIIDEKQFDKILNDIVKDPKAAFLPIAELYQDFIVRCRINQILGTPLSLNRFRHRFAIAQSGISEEAIKTDSWQKVLELSESLSDDLKGVFLLLARTALEELPCPSDEELARIYGTYSHSRARRLLTYFEERNLILVQTDLENRRQILFPLLGLQTKPN